MGETTLTEDSPHYRGVATLFGKASVSAEQARNAAKKAKTDLIHLKQALIDVEVERHRYRAELEKDSKEFGRNEMERSAGITVALAADPHYTEQSRELIRLKEAVAKLEIDVDYQERLWKESIVRMEWATARGGV